MASVLTEDLEIVLRTEQLGEPEAQANPFSELREGPDSLNMIDLDIRLREKLLTMSTLIGYSILLTKGAIFIISMSYIGRVIQSLSSLDRVPGPDAPQVSTEGVLQNCSSLLYALLTALLISSSDFCSSHVSFTRVKRFSVAS